MYCFKCGRKVEGECQGRLELNAVRFYHPECCSVDEPLPISDETQMAIAKSLIALAKLLGGYSDDKTH